MKLSFDQFLKLIYRFLSVSEPRLDDFISRKSESNLDSPTSVALHTANPDQCADLSDLKMLQAMSSIETPESSFVELPSNIETPPPSENYDSSRTDTQQQMSEESSDNGILSKEQLATIVTTIDFPVASSTQKILSNETSLSTQEENIPQITDNRLSSVTVLEKSSTNLQQTGKYEIASETCSNIKSKGSDLTNVNSCCNEMDPFKVIVEPVRDAKVKKSHISGETKKAKPTEVVSFNEVELFLILQSSNEKKVIFHFF